MATAGSRCWRSVFYLDFLKVGGGTEGALFFDALGTTIRGGAAPTAKNSGSGVNGTKWFAFQPLRSFSIRFSLGTG